jgi:hypothetical protein
MAKDWQPMTAEEIYSGFWLIGLPINWDSHLFGANPGAQNTNQECNQNLFCLFGTPWPLIGPVSATWHTCDYYAINESPTQYKLTPSYSCSKSCSDCGCESTVACAAMFLFKILDPYRNA